MTEIEDNNIHEINRSLNESIGSEDEADPYF